VWVLVVVWPWVSGLVCAACRVRGGFGVLFVLLVARVRGGSGWCACCLSLPLGFSGARFASALLGLGVSVLRLVFVVLVRAASWRCGLLCLFLLCASFGLFVRLVLGVGVVSFGCSFLLCVVSVVVLLLRSAACFVVGVRAS